MRLRARLVVATAAVAVPMVLALIWLDARSRHDAAEARLAELTRRTMPEQRARCEAAPEAWGGSAQPPPRDGDDRPAPGPRVAPPVSFPYSAALTSHDPRAPRLSRALLDELGARGWIAIDRRTFGARVTVLVRMPWTDGPCALVLTTGSTTPGFVGAFLPAGRVWLLPLVAVLIAILVAVGPVVGRIRRLTAVVRAASARGFVEVPVLAGADEVGELSRAFAAASGEVQRQLAAKDDRERALREFLANTTHDVMIPLTVLTQHLAALRDRGADPDAAAAAVTGALDEVHYLAALLHNLAATAKLDVGEPRLERTTVSLDAVVSRVVARHRTIAVERGVELDSGVPEAPVPIDADLTMIEQAVSNVVYNAIRYNRRGGHVAIVLDREPGARFVLRVLDDGPGIPAPQLGQLSKRGFRGDAARGRDTGGQGIGLHITHTVAALHGYQLTFTNRDGGGLEVALSGATVA